MKFSNKEVLIFDLDGTLIDSVPDLALSINQMLKALNITPYPTDVVRSWVGNGALVLTQRALSGNIDVSPELDSAFVDNALTIFLDFYAQNVCVDTTVYPHVRNTLETLHTSGFKLVIVTNKPEQFVRPILKKLELDHFFNMIVGGDTLPERKPHPMQLQHVCETLSVSPANCVMIGDSKNDIHAAIATNMESIGLTYGYNHGEDINSQGATIVLDDFADILDTLTPIAAGAH